MLLVLLAVRPASALDPAPHPEVAVRARMQTHWRLLTEIVSEVIGGRPEGARSVAARLADLRVDGLPADLRGPLTELRIRAGSVVVAGDLDATAAATARLAATCAGCHERAFAPFNRRMPSEAWDEDQRMVRHRWATDWLLVGLVSDSDVAWDRGARELRGAAEMELDRPEVSALREAFDALAERAVGLTDRGTQTEVLGELLATCARCHLEALGADAGR